MKGTGLKGIACEFCGKRKDDCSFFIGATKTPDWCMVEGTGKMACPDCYPKASAEGQAAIERHIKAFNAKA
jgi:hypothetical protein